MTAETLRILLIGNGGREHSLAWKLDQPPRVEAIYVVQGNSGIGCIPKVRNIGNIKDDYSALLSFSLTQGITLVVPSTEKPLVDGIKGIFGACEEIVKPTIECREGFPFVGALSIGLMLTQDGPKVLEYDVRFGDPEAQTLLPLIGTKSDLAEIMLACVEQRLHSVDFVLDSKFCATAVLSTEGYPNCVNAGQVIELCLNNAPEDTLFFHAGTTDCDGQLYSSRGRVISVLATATHLVEAIRRAYEGIRCVHFRNMHYGVLERTFVQRHCETTAHF